MPPSEVKRATTDKDFATGRALIEEYAAALDVDLCFQDFPEEISHLSEMYGPPRGFLLLACVSGEAIGCVAVREHDDDACEMKRLYVKPEHRGTGLGRRLAEIAVRNAKELGYARMVLDTLPEMTEAQSLYRSLGFRETTGYYPNPLGGVRYLACQLADVDR